MKKIGLSYFLILTLYCFILFVFIFILADLAAALIVFSKINKFMFIWKDAIEGSLDKGSTYGVLTGIGLWIKAKLQEYQEKKKSPKPDEQ